MRLDDIVGLEHGAGEHELPADLNALHLKRSSEIEVGFVLSDEDDASLRGDHFSHRSPDAVDFIEVRDVADGFMAQFLELSGHVIVGIDDVIGSALPAPIGTFWS